MQTIRSGGVSTANRRIKPCILLYEIFRSPSARNPPVRIFLRAGSSAGWPTSLDRSDRAPDCGIIPGSWRNPAAKRSADLDGRRRPAHPGAPAGATPSADHNRRLVRGHANAHDEAATKAARDSGPLAEGNSVATAAGQEGLTKVAVLKPADARRGRRQGCAETHYIVLKRKAGEHIATDDGNWVGILPRYSGLPSSAHVSARPSRFGTVIPCQTMARCNRIFLSPSHQVHRVGGGIEGFNRPFETPPTDIATDDSSACFMLWLGCSAGRRVD